MLKNSEITVAFCSVCDIADVLIESIKSGKYEEITLDFCDMSESEIAVGYELSSWFGFHAKKEFDTSIISVGYYGGGYYAATEFNPNEDSKEDLVAWLISTFSECLETFDGKSICLDVTKILPEEENEE